MGKLISKDLKTLEDGLALIEQTEACQNYGIPSGIPFEGKPPVRPVLLFCSDYLRLVSILSLISTTLSSWFRDIQDLGRSSARSRSGQGQHLDRKILENDKIRVHLHPARGKRRGPVLWNQEIH